MEHGPKQAGVAKLRIRQHACPRDATRAHLAEQGQRLAPFLLKAHAAGNPRRGPRGGGQPRLGQVQRGAEQVGAHPGPQGRRNGHLAIGDLAQRATVLARDPDRVRALLRETRAVDDHQPLAFGQHRPQAPPDAVGAPRGVGDEVLKGLVGPRIGYARQHRFHRLARAVAEQPLDVPAQGQLLGTMPEALLEGVEPPHQAVQLANGVTVVHCRAAYRIRRKCTMSSN